MELKIQDLDRIKEVAHSYPEYDVTELVEKSKANPKWLAFGSGNIFRGYVARIVQDMLNENLYDSGVAVVEGYDEEIIDAVYKPYDNLVLAATLKKDGDFQSDLIGSITESLKLSCDLDRVEEIAINPDLQIISFIITEMGYGLTNSAGDLLPIVKSDMENDPKDSKHTMGKATYLLYRRFKENGAPVTMLSIDNLSENGDVLKSSIIKYAKAWIDAGEMDEEFLDYLNDESKVTYPISMIDKITPRPDSEVSEYLKGLGFENIDPVQTELGTYIAPFVNLEEAEYLAIEDIFANGRPPFEDVGVYMTDRETVKNIETMKVTTCLNPLHTALAVFGSLLGHDRIYKCMEDEELVALVRGIGYDEGLPVVKDPGIINPKEFIDEVIDVRFPNPYIPDMPQRIATDTSLKVGVRFGETIKAYRDAADRDPKDLKLIPLVLAGWIRYLMGLDDNLEEIEISPDPRLEELQELLKNNEIGSIDEEAVRKLLANKVIFGENLVELGLDDKIINYLKELSAGKGAIRETLKKYLD